MQYEPPLRDYRFILHEALKIQDETAHAKLKQFSLQANCVE